MFSPGRMGTLRMLGRLRDVEEILAMRGVAVSYETVRD